MGVEVPLFEFEQEGVPHGTRSAWQRKEMVIAVLHRDCPRCEPVRTRLRAREGALDDPEVHVLVVDDRAPAEVLQRLREAAGQPEDAAFVVLGNRFLELYAVVEPHAMPADDLMKDVLAWVEVMAERCAECSLQGDAFT